MRYKWIDLQGYAGFFNGLGLTQVKIDFTKCKTNKIIIRGSNGSGKSTLINAINPNPDGNDCFIPNMEARKNICITNNGIDYVIRYIHPVNNNGNRGTTKGYISKTINGELVELNPNGNISSCKDIIYDEFKLDANFISLSQLSSEDKGLVDLKPAERKRLLNSIINILEVYNGIYKNLSKKSSVYKSNMQSLVTKINYLGDELKLKSELQNVTNRLEVTEQEKEKTLEAIAAVKIKMTNYLDILRENNYDETVNELRSTYRDHKAKNDHLFKRLQELEISDVNSIDDLIEVLAEINKSKSILEITNQDINKQIPTLLANREVEFKELQDKQAKLESMQSEYNYMEMKEAMDNAKSIVDEYHTIFEQMGLKNINLISRDEFETAMQALSSLRTYINALTSTFSMTDISVVLNDTDKGYSSKLMSLNSSRNAEISNRSNIIREIDTFNSMRDITSILSKRPDKCKIDTCPFIENALQVAEQYPESRYVELNKQLADVDASIKDIDSEIEKYTTYSQIFQYVHNIDKELNDKMKFISKLPVRQDFYQSFWNRVLSGDNFKDIDELYKYVDCANILEEYKTAKEQLSIYESEYKVYEAKNNIIESICIDIEKLNAKTNAMATEIDNLRNEYNKNSISIENLTKASEKVSKLIEEYKEINALSTKIQELEKIKSSMDSNSQEIDKLQSELDILNHNLGSVNNDIKALSERKEQIVHSLNLLSDYKSELEAYTNNYNRIEKIRYYSSPTSGIQTLFISLYMNKVLGVANDLISLLFDGEFMIQPFIINDSEFRIPCVGSGLLHDDISSMSLSQRAMISMILSFAILQQSSTDYNIVKLDEIDSGLDSFNRSKFINLLDRLMVMLNCEQAFLISHNNELDTSTADVIVLKNPGNEIYNGNIIWKY